MRARVGWIVATVLVAAPTWAAVLCEKKSGAVYVRTACKKKEMAVDGAALGLQGPKGDTGSAGGPGPTASTSASNPNTSAIGGTIATVVRLTTSPQSDGALTTTFASRVVVTGSVVLSNHIPATPNAYARESCQAQIQAVGDVSWTDVGSPTVVDLPYSASIDAQVGFAVVGAIEEPAGSYDVRILCTPSNLSDQIHFNGAGVTVVAASS